MSLANRLSLAAVLLSIVGCSVLSEDVAEDDAAIRASKVVEPVGGGRVRIKRAALGDPWMFRTAITPRNDTPAFAGRAFDDYQKILPLVGRVALFRDEGGGKWTLRDLTTVGLADPVIATFDAEESKDAIVIDVDKAFRELRGDVSVFEPAAPVKLPKIRFVSSKIVGDKLTQEGSTVFLRRIIETDMPDKPGASVNFHHIRLDYALGPYVHHDGFVPRTNTPNAGFYVNPPVNDASKGPTSYVHRHDENKPIVYAVPNGTPEERVDDMKTAAKYWNKILDRAGVRARVKIETLKAGTDAFLTNANTIEFVTVPSPGGRGISQTDALTGRIVKANIHVSSVFTDAAKEAVETRWARMRATAGEELTPPTPKIVERAISDYYVDTFAHEIGHTLGLRHNFAGNLASPMSGDEWVRALDGYLRSDIDEKAVFTTSIMDYLPTEYAMLLGAHIRRGDEPFAYDVAAVSAVYGNKKVPANALGPYCEKEEEPTHADCLQNDIGPNTLTDFTVNEALADTAIRLTLTAKAGAPLVDMVEVPDSKTGEKRDLRALQLGFAVTQHLTGFRAGAKFVVAKGDAAEHQRTAFAALDGEVGTLAKHAIESKTLSDADVAAVSGKLRGMLEKDLVAAKVTVPTATIDAYFTQFNTDFAAVVRGFLTTTSFVSVK